MHKLLVSLLLLFPLLAAAQDLQAHDNTLPASKPDIKNYEAHDGLDPTGVEINIIT